ncbi:hypothetical protein [Thermodesulfatator atlanticus]|uniref:hypothetical protein n=1 Tax=Thermodesulfatator atlanticus TaxID=501497 RepID=UPI0003B4B46E|nr:hypothetical protein [Thermodesulfatator atlanticus]
MFNAFKYFEEFRETFGEEAALKLIWLASEIYESLSQNVTKTEFNELKKRPLQNYLIQNISHDIAREKL